MAPLQSRLRHSRILVIDESRFACALIADVLRALGASSVWTARDGEEAEERLRYLGPEVVLFERAAPRFDGVEFARAVRAGAVPLHRDAALLMVTGRSTQSEVELARRSGVDEFLAKPFTVKAVERLIGEAVLRKRSFVDALSYVGPCRRRGASLLYGGPLRRFLDEEPDLDPIDDHQRARQALLAKLEQARSEAVNLAPFARRPTRLLFRTAKSMEALALEIGDGPLAQTMASLARYLSGAGAGPRMNARVAHAHLDVAAQLLELPRTEEGARRKAAADLADRLHARLRPVSQDRLLL